MATALEFSSPSSEAMSVMRDEIILGGPEEVGSGCDTAEVVDVGSGDDAIAPNGVAVFCCSHSLKCHSIPFSL